MDTHIILAFTRSYREPVAGAYPLGNGYRFYLPHLMRFNSPDDWSPFGAGGVNPYSYCDSDPINRSDPSGHFGFGDAPFFNLIDNAAVNHLDKQSIDDEAIAVQNASANSERKISETPPHDGDTHAEFGNGGQKNSVETGSLSPRKKVKKSRSTGALPEKATFMKHMAHARERVLQTTDEFDKFEAILNAGGSFKEIVAQRQKLAASLARTHQAIGALEASAEEISLLERRVYGVSDTIGIFQDIGKEFEKRDPRIYDWGWRMFKQRYLHIRLGMTHIQTPRYRLPEPPGPPT